MSSMLNIIIGTVSVLVLFIQGVKAAPTYSIDSKVTDGTFTPFGVALDSAGNVYYSQLQKDVIFKVNFTSATKTPYVFAGTVNSPGNTGDNGPAISCKFTNPHMMHVDKISNELLIADFDNYVVRKINLNNGIISLVAGNYAQLSGGPTSSGQATSISLHSPQSPWSDTAHNVYISDANADKIYKVTASTGILSVLQLTEHMSTYRPQQIWGDSSNAYLYVVNQGNHLVHKIDLTTGPIMKISVFAGLNGTSIFPGDTGDGGLATSAKLRDPRGIWGDLEGNMYIVDGGNEVVRRVDASTGIIERISGTYQTSSRTGDGGPALSATHTTDMKQIVGNDIDTLYLVEANTIRVIYSATAAPTFMPTLLCRPNVTQSTVVTTVVTKVITYYL